MRWRQCPPLCLCRRRGDFPAGMLGGDGITRRQEAASILGGTRCCVDIARLPPALSMLLQTQSCEASDRTNDGRSRSERVGLAIFDRPCGAAPIFDRGPTLRRSRFCLESNLRPSTVRPRRGLQSAGDMGCHCGGDCHWSDRAGFQGAQRCGKSACGILDCDWCDDGIQCTWAHRRLSCSSALYMYTYSRWARTEFETERRWKSCPRLV